MFAIVLGTVVPKTFSHTTTFYYTIQPITSLKTLKRRKETKKFQIKIMFRKKKDRFEKLFWKKTFTNPNRNYTTKSSIKKNTVILRAGC